VVDGWWGIAMAGTVVLAAVVITRAFSIGSDREETRAILPPVGLRLWMRPEPDGPGGGSADAPGGTSVSTSTPSTSTPSTSTEGGGG
jgi:hypothetical protein